jgi:hypothetical protein
MQRKPSTSDVQPLPLRCRWRPQQATAPLLSQYMADYRATAFGDLAPCAQSLEPPKGSVSRHLEGGRKLTRHSSRRQVRNSIVAHTHRFREPSARAQLSDRRGEGSARVRPLRSASACCHMGTTSTRCTAASRRSTREQVADYIESYYNLVRINSHVDYMSRIEFETNAPSSLSSQICPPKSGELHESQLA